MTETAAFVGNHTAHNAQDALDTKEISGQCYVQVCVMLVSSE
jgi:hypothetical protein